LGAVRLFPHLYALSPALYGIPWLAPTVIGLAAITLLQRHYRKKPGAVKHSGSGTAQQSQSSPAPAAR
jgi:hypothetical protein